jgi:hypothetical protein
MDRFRLHQVVLLCLAARVKADGWDTLTNNLAADLAPLIQLFGEAVTKQFLSESISIWDNVIFACAPLGILTAVVSAIRVSGTPSLKAFIGRGQGSDGTAELELLSCTSDTTAEVYSNGAITRIFGKPRIMQILYDGCESKRAAMEPDDRTVDADLQKFSQICGVQRFDDVLINVWHPPARETYGWYMDGWLYEEFPHAPPNLSLNIGIKRPSKALFARQRCLDWFCNPRCCFSQLLPCTLGRASSSKVGSGYLAMAFPAPW